MSEVHVKENESLDSALRRFKRNCAKDGRSFRSEKEGVLPEPQRWSSVARSLRLREKIRIRDTINFLKISALTKIGQGVFALYSYLFHAMG